MRAFCAAFVFLTAFAALVACGAPAAPFAPQDAGLAPRSSGFLGGVASKGGITNGAGANVVIKSDGTNAVASSATDDGTTFAVASTKLTVTEASGNTAVLGTLTADSGNRVIDTSATLSTNTLPVSNGANTLTNSLVTDTGSIFSYNTTSFTVNTSGNGSVTGQWQANTASFGSTSATDTFTASFNKTTQVASRNTMNGNNTGTFNTTSGALTSTSLTLSDTATRSSGANNLTNIGLKSSASGAQVNDAAQFAGGNININAGHFVTTGAALSGSNLTSCGTSPSITGTDVAGIVTTGSAATTCTITFAATYTNEPSCIVETMGSATEPTFTVSATAITMSVDIASTKYHYICIGLSDP